MSIQQHLHEAYYTDRQFCDRFLTAEYVPFLQEMLPDCPPKIAHDLTERVSNRLNTTPSSVRSAVVNFKSLITADLLDGENYEAHS